MKNWINKIISRNCILAIVGGLVVAWVLYGTVGHRAIEVMYKSNSSIIVNHIMQGRAVTPLENYLRGADAFMLLNTIRALAVLTVLILTWRSPMLPVFVLAGVGLATVLTVICLNAYPSLVGMMGLDAVEYFADRKLYIPDELLAYKGKPRLNITFYKPSDVRQDGEKPRLLPTFWTTDEEGFRNVGQKKHSDIVLLGDGMITSGRRWEETFGKRLEDHLPGWSVSNLGVGGYSPFQYLEVLRAYGIKKHPRYAVFSFNEGNDLQDIQKYIQWRSGSLVIFSGGYELGIKSPLLKFTTAYSETVKYLKQKSWEMTEGAVLRALGTEAYAPMDPHLASVTLPTGRTFSIRFIDRQHIQSAEEIQKTDDWQELKKLLIQFKTTCTRHQIRPLVLFIPTAAHIYAQYSTVQSGENWLKIRDQQIRAKATLESAFTRLSHELGIFVVSLSPTFESAAKSGLQVYDSFSVHINLQGTELGAAYVSSILRSAVDGHRVISPIEWQ